MPRSLINIIKDVVTHKMSDSNYTSLNTTILNSLREQRAKIETDYNDQISVGSYKTKNFEMCPQAQKLYVSLPRNVNINEMEKAAILLDQLFGLEKKVISKERATRQDSEISQEIIKRVMLHARAANLQDRFDFLIGHQAKIDKYLVDENNTVESDKFNLNKEMKRFYVPSYDRTAEKDVDIDSSKFALSRNLTAQRKLKIIDND